MTAEERWELFNTRCQLENFTKVSVEEQRKLESIPDEDLRLILQKINEGISIRTIHLYLQMYYEITIDPKALARYWRRALPGYMQAEEQQRELRTAERALRKLNQGELS